MSEAGPVVGGRRRDSGPPGLAPLAGLYGGVGCAFLVVGLTDLLLSWLPPSFGSAEWEFATVTASFEMLPVVVLGLALVLGSAATTNRRWLGWGASVLALLLLVWIVGAMGLYALDLPVALSGLPEGPIAGGMRKAVLRTSLQALTYALVFGWMAFKGFRHWRARRT